MAVNFDYYPQVSANVNRLIAADHAGDIAIQDGILWGFLPASGQRTGTRQWDWATNNTDQVAAEVLSWLTGSNQTGNVTKNVTIH